MNASPSRASCSPACGPPERPSRYTSRMRPLTLGLTLLLIALAAPAVPQSGGGAYNIEVIIFRSGADPADAEGVSGDRPASDSGDVAGSGGVARLIGPLPAASLQLGAIVERLRASGAYRPLVHAGWSQTPGPWGSRSGFPLARLGVVADGLAGTAYLERGQYLHLGFSVTLGRATLSELRRVRLGEKNYFDNPDFGLIAVVTAAR